VGGVAADNLAQWIAAGATGFGIGGQLYQPGDSAQTVGQRAREFVHAWNAVQR
jgi:2-dehydro-3-deoxyphosphogalactonate aldolase